MHTYSLIEYVCIALRRAGALISFSIHQRTSPTIANETPFRLKECSCRSTGWRRPAYRLTAESLRHRRDWRTSPRICRSNALHGAERLAVFTFGSNRLW